MCGITGILSPNRQIPLRDLKDLNDNISHRGPDDEGYCILSSNNFESFKGDATTRDIDFKHINTYSNKEFNLGIAHRRFSIIDTSSAGHQPFFSEEDQIALSFNGEIYNYIEIKKELSNRLGVEFKSNSDTEVILQAYKYWGLDCFTKFNGFWSLAIIHGNQLILSRDRIGKKPLYYSNDNDLLIFSSEIRPLLSLRKKYGFKNSISKEAAFDYLRLDRRNAFTDSFFSEIKQVESASYMVFSLNYVEPEKKEKFWDLSNINVNDQINLSSSKEQFLTLLNDSINLRLRADVPIAVNLSGGLDSSAIVSLATKSLRKKNQTLAVHNFKFKDDTSLDESIAAREISDFCGSNYNEIILDKKDVFKSIDNFIYESEEPVHSLSSIVQKFAWNKISEQGYKVVLHGAANDELMLGYDYLKKIELLSRFRNLELESISQDLIHEKLLVLKLIKWLIFRDNRETQVNGNFLSKELCNSNQERYHKYLNNIDNINLSSKDRMKADLLYLRVPYWCNLMDKNMMSIPIEVRMPYLDHKLVEFLTSLPTKFFLKKGLTKFLLRHSMSGMLPNSIIRNKKKTGFSIPKENWHFELRNSFLEMLENKDLEEFFDLKGLKSNTGKLTQDEFWRFYNFCSWLNSYKL